MEHSVYLRLTCEQPVGEDALIAISDALHPGSVVAGDGWVSVQTSVETRGWQDAVHRVGVDLAQAARTAGVTTGGIVEVHVRPWAEFAAGAEHALPDLVSGPEAAAILSVSRQRLHQLVTEHPRFPAAIYQLAIGRLWLRAGIEQFAREWERKPGRPVSRSA